MLIGRYEEFDGRAMLPIHRRLIASTILSLFYVPMMFTYVSDAQA